MVFDFFRSLLGDDGTDDATPEPPDDDDPKATEPEMAPEEVLEEIVRYLEEVDLGAEEVRTIYQEMLNLDLEEGKTTADYIVEADEAIQGELERLDEQTGFEVLHMLLQWSPLAATADWRYTTGMAEDRLNEVLETRGLRLRLQRPDGKPVDPIEETDDVFEIRLMDGEELEAETAFSYPDSDLGVLNFPALVQTINRELLGETDVRFYRLPSMGDDWAFLLLTDAHYADLTAEHGSPIEAFGQKLLLTDVENGEGREGLSR